MKLFRFIFAISIVFASCKGGEDPVDIDAEPVLEVTNYAYCSDKSGSAQIWINRASGNIQLTESEEFQYVWPRVCADGSKILYYQIKIDDEVLDPTDASLFSMNIESGETQELINQGKFPWRTHAAANWSRDGKKITLSAVPDSTNTSQIYICDENGDNPQRISLRNEYDYFDPVFSKDGTSIFCSVVPEGTDAGDINTEIHLIEISTGNELRLTYNNSADFHPAINSDESIIIYESLIDPSYLGIGLWQLNKYVLRDSSETPLLETKHLSFLPRFKSGTDDIYFVGLDVEDLSTTIYVTDSKGQTPKPLLSDDFNCIGVDPF